MIQDNSVLVERIIRRASAMRAERSTMESLYRACYEVTYPERGDGWGGDEVRADGAPNKRAELLDSTGTDAARMLASNVQGGMTPANAIWFALDVGDESDDERRWLDHAALVMWERIHGANYDSAHFEAALDAVIAGWFVMYIDEDRDSGQLYFQQWPLVQCYIACSKPGRPVDTVYRCFKLTAQQAVSEYGTALSELVQTAAVERPDAEFDFIHVIEPRTAYPRGSLRGLDLPVRSCHIEAGAKRLLRESGYHEMPVVVPRWMQMPRTAYGIGPVHAALPVIRELNALLRLETIALGRAAAGVYVGVDDGVLNPATVKVTGGNVVVANSIDSIKELPSGADFNVTFSKADQLRAEIRKLLMADQLQPQDGPAMTATEVHTRLALIRQLMGPLFGRFQAEDLAPTIDRVFGLTYRRGRPELGGVQGQVLIDDAPDSLGDSAFQVRYQSPLARAQKLDGVTAIERLAANMGAMAQAGHPEALDLLDTDQAIRTMGEGLGVPDKVLRDVKEVAAVREARAEQQAQAAQAAQAQQMQTMAADAAFKRTAQGG